MAPPTVQTLQRLAAETGGDGIPTGYAGEGAAAPGAAGRDRARPGAFTASRAEGRNGAQCLLPRSRPALGGYRLELRRRAGPGGDGARTSGGRCRDRPPVRLAGLRCPAPAHRARGRQVARALRVRTRWQRVAGTRPELHGAPAAVRRSPHGVAYSRPRWDGARSPSRSPRDRGREDRDAVRPGCCVRSVRCTANPRDRGTRSGLDQGRRPGARRLQPAGGTGGAYRRMSSDAIHASFAAISPSAWPAICSAMRAMSTRGSHSRSGSKNGLRARDSSPASQPARASSELRTVPPRAL